MKRKPWQQIFDISYKASMGNTNHPSEEEYPRRLLSSKQRLMSEETGPVLHAYVLETKNSGIRKPKVQSNSKSNLLTQSPTTMIASIPGCRRGHFTRTE